MVKTSLFEKERATLSQLITAERLALAGYFAGTAIGFFLPLFSPDMNKWSKLSLLSLSTVGSAAGTLALYSRRDKERLYSILGKAQDEELKRELAVQVATNQTAAQMAGAQEIVDKIVSYPVWQWGYWGQKYGVTHLLPPLEIPVSPSVEPQSNNIQLGGMNYPDIDELGGTEESVSSALSPDWMDDDFLSASKIVVGTKGSGKTTYLNFEAVRFLQLYPEGELRIGDLHNDFDEEKWLPGVDKDTLAKKFVAKSVSFQLALIRRAGQILRERVEKNLKLKNGKVQPFKVIIDEVVAFFNQLEEDEIEEVLQIVSLCEFEGRKFGVFFTLGLHSLKKEICKIDSSVWANMEILILGRKILTDANTKFPSDFNKKQLLAEFDNLKDLLVSEGVPKNAASPCLVRKDDNAPEIVVMPNMESYVKNTRITFGSLPSENQSEDSTNTATTSINTYPEPQREKKKSDDVFKEVQLWLEQLPEPPNPQQLALKWLEITGIKINQAALEALLKYYGLKPLTSEDIEGLDLAPEGD